MRCSKALVLGVLLVFAPVVGALAVPTDSHARPLQTAIDPDGPYSSSDAKVVSRRVRAAGASAIRLLVNWRQIAPESPGPGFDAANPAEPSYDWQQFEHELIPAVAAGLEPIVVVRSAPGWAEGSGSGRAGTVRPDPDHLGRFVRAAAQRYSGRFAGLPRVRYWQAWNEPNHFGFLNPQEENGSLVAAAHYRKLVNAFADAVHAANPDNSVIAGGLAPFNNLAPDQRVVPTLEFMRSLLCVSPSGEATCGDRIAFDIWSHHPYTSGDPTHSAAHPDDVSIPDLPRMRRVLRAAVRAKHVVTSQSIRFWVTEFAWDTRPPDPGGVPSRLHARWTAEALYRMWRAGVTLVTWYKLRDDDREGRPHSATFECGLYFRCTSLACDRPKRSLRAFRFPFVAFRSGRRVYVWGRTPNGRRRTVTVEKKARKGWRRVARIRADRWGVFSRRIRTRPRGRLRARFGRGANRRSEPFSLRRPPDRPVNPFG
jgi:hypothetical protein